MTTVGKGDLRLKKRANPEYKTDYARIAQRIRDKICYACGHVPVVNRKICVECSKRAVHHNAVSGFRKILRLHGIENPIDAWGALVNAKCENADDVMMLEALSNALEACDYRQENKDYHE